MTCPDRHRSELDALGFTILEGVMDPAFVERMRVRVDELLAEEARNPRPACHWEQNAVRIDNLADEGQVFLDAIMQRKVLALVRLVLGPQFKLSSIQVRSANPCSNIPQPLHADLNQLPDDRGAKICNTLWMLDAFTRENGALRVIPGSHRSQTLPEDALDDLYASHRDEMVVTGIAGTVVVLNAHLWHGALANRTAHRRRGLSALFCRQDIAQQQYQKQALRAETQAALSRELRRLLALDDPRNDELALELMTMKLESHLLRSRIEGSKTKDP